MARMAALWRRLRSRAGRRALESGLDEEIRFHLDQQTEKNLRAGMGLEEARRQALVRFGGVESVKDRTRDEFAGAALDAAWRDARYAVRALRRAPGFTVAATLTLGLSMGSAVAVFSVVDGVLLQPLPYPDPEALVSIWNRSRDPNDPGEVPVSAAQFFTYRDEGRVFAALGLWASGTATVTGGPEPEMVPTLRVTSGTLHALAVAPALGRWFSEEDDAPGSLETVILTGPYWQRRYGGDGSLIGRTVTVDARPRTVIGVMPAGFRFLGESPDLVLPLRLDRRGLLLGAFNYRALGRLQPGVTLEEAGADVERMTPVWLGAWPAPPGFDKLAFERSPAVRPLKQDVVGGIGDVLWVLMGTTGLVLLIACANVANLQLLRAERRRQELAVRVALGAGGVRIAAGWLLESVLLGLLGGALGLATTFALLRLLVALGPANLPRLGEITVDPVVPFFGSILSLVCSVAFGLFPLARHGPGRALPSLRGGERTSSEGRERHRMRNTLVVVQVSLALVLLVGSGLMIRTFRALRAVPPGFSAAHEVQLARITIPRTQVEEPERVFRMQSDILDRVAAIPGVTSASWTSAAPMEPFVSANALFGEDETAAGGGTRRFKFVFPGSFATVGTPLVAGRDFEGTDLHRRRHVAVISAGLAREMWGEPAAALGKRIRENPEGPWREIVGVVADVSDDGLHAPPPPIAYWPALMADFEGERIRVRRSMTLVIRSPRTGTEGFLKDVQGAVWSVNASFPLARVQTLEAIHRGSLARTSFVLVMLGLAAAMALFLGLVGIYGVIACGVAQRGREIGIRVALGASPRELERMFVGQGVRLAGVGVACGSGAALGASRAMSSLLFGVRPLDPATYVAVAAILIASAALASYLPARRAVAVDPMDALRGQ